MLMLHNYITPVLGLVLPASAQDRTLTDQLLTDLGRYCDRATEVSYRSQMIESSDGTTRVHIEGMLRKIVDPESSLRERDASDYCYGDVMETLSTEVVIDGQRNTFELLDEPLRDTYLVLNALSLSADDRYLVAEADFVYGGLGHQASVAFFDLEAREIVPSGEICANEFNTEYDYTSFEGFLSPTIAVVFCSIFDLTNDTQVERYEAVNLTSGTSRVLPSKPDNLQNYGIVVDDMEVMQVQKFKL